MATNYSNIKMKHSNNAIERMRLIAGIRPDDDVPADAPIEALTNDVLATQAAREYQAQEFQKAQVQLMFAPYITLDPQQLEWRNNMKVEYQANDIGNHRKINLIKKPKKPEAKWKTDLKKWLFTPKVKNAK